MNEWFNRLGEMGIIPVVVIEKAAGAPALGQALLAGGLPCAEITFRTAAAAQAVEAIATKCPDVLVGAGTILTIEQAKTAAAKGVEAFVLDVNLSRGTSGIDLLKDVRAGETAAATDTIVIMTSGDHRRQSECQNAGADQFLLKPYPPNALSGYINDLLSKR